MKRISAIVAMGALLSSCQPTPKEAANYNDHLMEQQKAVVIKYDELLETYDTYVPQKMDDALFAFQSQVENSVYTVRNSVELSGGSSLKEALLNYLEVYQTIANEDAPELVRLYKIPENEFTPEMKAIWDGKYKAIDQRIKDAALLLKDEQESFAKKFNLKIQ